MKIALLTFHNAANYGAAFQAYALQKALDNEGFNNEYINYQNKHRINSYSITYHVFNALKNSDFAGALKYLLGAPFLFLRKMRFSIFYNKYLRRTDEVYRTSQQALTLNGKYDKFIVGSDQVWNWSNNGGDYSYLLSFVADNEKKISYSSSFGIAEIPYNLQTEYKKHLSKFKHLAVREKAGVEMVAQLINRRPKLVLDPVFLLSKEQWLEIADSKKNNEKFIFSYTNKPNQLETFINSTKINLENICLYKLSRNIKIIDFLKRGVKVKYSMSPSKFLSIVRDAELIVSASFHCIALAIILNKPFIAILTGNIGKDERITSLLSLLQLTNRIYNEKMDESQVMQPIDYTRVNKTIYDLKLESYDYLINAIQN